MTLRTVDTEIQQDREAAFAEEQARQDMSWLMDQEKGRRIVYRLLARCGVHRTVFDENPICMARNEGARSQGLSLLSDVMDAGIEGYFQMLRENA